MAFTKSPAVNSSHFTGSAWACRKPETSHPSAAISRNVVIVHPSPKMVDRQRHFLHPPGMLRILGKVAHFRRIVGRFVQLRALLARFHSVYWKRAVRTMSRFDQ